MINNKTLRGTFAYIIVSFPLAVIWHVLLFESRYQQFGYFDGEPSFILGFLTMVVQGFMLSFIYPTIKGSNNKPMQGLRYALLMGVFFWSSHVLAFVAKQQVDDAWLFIAMESFYLCLQFGLYGLCIGRIYRQSAS